MSVRILVIRRSPFLLLEVMIAFFLVAMCALPLMQPQFVMLKTERTFINGVTLDRLVNEFYAELLLRFYRGEVPWASIGKWKSPVAPVPITNPKLAEAGFKGEYVLRILPYFNKSGVHSKGASTKAPITPNNRHLLEVKYTFTHAAEPEPLTYSYWLYVQTLEAK